MTLLEQYTTRLREYNLLKTKFAQSSAAAKEACKIEETDRMRAREAWNAVGEARLAFEESIK